MQLIQFEGSDVLSFHLKGLEGDLPSWTPGAHIDVHLPNGMVRSYSLSNVEAGQDMYRITVQRDPNSRGGSTAMHEQIRCGQVLQISPPRNNFPLEERSDSSVFIAGGIGVTPFLPMLSRLNKLACRWTLYYSVRTPDRAAHLEELQSLAAQGCGTVEMNFDGLPGGQMLNLRGLIAGVPMSGHVYCCGPEGMLNAFRANAQARLPEAQVHFEYFSSHVVAAATGGFTVTLAKSGREVHVKPGKTILHALRESGIEVAYSCEEGVCGACETRVLNGKPDHRDMILSERERLESKTMMICCSGSLSDRLVLDL